MDQLLTWLSLGSLAGILPALLLGILIVLYVRQAKFQNPIQPLDLADAKKLDRLVSKQIESAIEPILRSQGYTDTQIKPILTRTSQKNTH